MHMMPNLDAHAWMLQIPHEQPTEEVTFCALPNAGVYREIAAVRHAQAPCLQDGPAANTFHGSDFLAKP
jgi:hypothetical protein